MKKCVFFSFWFISTIICAQQSIEIGLLLDFDRNDKFDQYMDQLSDEIQKTLGSSYKVSIRDENILQSHVNKTETQKVYRELSEHCDFILTLGVLSSVHVFSTKNFKVPTIALGIFNPFLEDLNLNKDKTGINNFSLVKLSFDMEEELREFKRIRDFKYLTILVDYRSQKLTAPDKGILFKKKLEKEFDCQVDFVFLNEVNINQSLNQISANSDAVYLAVPVGLYNEDVKQIADFLIERKIVSFSMMSEHVHQGILACLSNDNGVIPMLRKIAVMIDGELNGEDLGDMKVNLNQKEELSINMITATKINYKPSFEVFYSAQMLALSEQLSFPTLTLYDIIEKSVQENLNLKISIKDQEITEQDVRSAISQLYPDVELTATTSFIDKAISNPQTGQAEQSVAAKLNIQQVIYSEDLFANIRIQKYLNQIQSLSSQQDLLDVILDCFMAYFNVLKAKTNLEIQLENQRLSKTNLSLAKMKVNVGSSSNADLYRWESELANASQSVIEAGTSLMLAKFQLNTLLNNSLGVEFLVEDVSLDHQIFKEYNDQNPIAEFIKGPLDLLAVAEFLAKESIENLPNRVQLNVNSDILQRQAKMYKRKFYSPTVAAQFQWNQQLYRGGNGSDPLPGLSFVDEYWSAGINLSYPIFNKNQRAINLKKTNQQLEKLEYQMLDFDNSIQFNIQMKTINLMKAITNIHYSSVSSENAGKNFELIQNNYKQGLANITNLLDAQKAALNTKSAHALSVYQYLTAYIELEHAVGFYSMLTGREKLDDFYVRLKEFLNKN